MNARLTFLAAALFGAAGVVLGAFGAHALRGFLLERGMRDAWETAVQYQLIHAVALLALGAYASHSAAASRLISLAARCWGAGIVCFSGSLYLLAAGAPHWVGPITPIGGLLLIAGWVLAAASALAAPTR